MAGNDYRLPGKVVWRAFRGDWFDACIIDQNAASSARLCYDPSHGHPVGGSHWWTAGYWEMMDRIREKMPEDRMVTSECNAEPFVRHFDGYLTWHWQNQDQVPGFAAVYGGAIQLFGRAYNGGQATPEEYRLACRMKAAEQLCFGEQIGWFDVNTALDEGLVPFFRQVVSLRWKFRQYFYAGEMARPPKLAGDMPQVSADWRWGGGRVIAAPAVRGGAWRMPSKQRAVLLLVNVAEEPVEVEVGFDAADNGLSGETIRVTPYDGTGAAGEPFECEKQARRAVTLPAKSAAAWELGE